MKKRSVCKGCKYLIPDDYTYTDLRNACDYAERTGNSRLIIENENGGYSKDSCPCYEKGRRRRGKKMGIKV